jgi:hypothetical protein
VKYKKKIPQKNEKEIGQRKERGNNKEINCNGNTTN